MSLEATTANVVEKAKASDALGSTIIFVFNGGEGAVFLDGTSGENVVSNENKEAECTVGIDFSDFNDLLSGKLSPMEAFMGGKLNIEGDMGVAMKLQSIF